MLTEKIYKVSHGRVLDIQVTYTVCICEEAGTSHYNNPQPFSFPRIL